MLQAMLRGKLRREEGMEDLLTSNTFGLMKYLPAEAVLLPFLREAHCPHSGPLPPAFTEGVAAVERWRFWPWLEMSGCLGCEPDVEIVLRHQNGERTGLLIEAKYRSGKSSFAAEGDDRPNDQLAREYDNLAALAQAEGLTRAAVVYVTADWTCPTAEIEESQREHEAKRGGRAAIYWLSWRALPEVLEAVSGQGADAAQDMRALLLALELTTFCRLRYEGVRNPGWRFAVTTARWDWNLPASLPALYSWRQT
jgi:hypothetical protein